MDGLQGAVLNVKMDYIEGWTEARRTVASHYDRLLANSRLPATGAAFALPARLSRVCYRAYRSATRCKKRFKGPVSEPASIIPFRFIFKRPMGTLGMDRAISLLRKLWPIGFYRCRFMPSLRPEQVAEVVRGLERAFLIKAA